ncbi:MAG: trigger factor, partial [Clostridia bacterium]|nr:trigger factor [Clostridia bacterium]
LIREFGYRLSSQGLNMEQYMQITGATADTFKEQFKDQAEAQVKSSLVLEKIVKLENIEVTEEDVEKELQTMADMYGMELDKVKTLIGDNEKESMKEDLKMKKAVELIAENAKVGKSAAKKTTAKKPAAKAADKLDAGEKAPAKKAPAKKTTAAKSTTAKKTTTKAKKDEE